MTKISCLKQGLNPSVPGFVLCTVTFAWLEYFPEVKLFKYFVVWVKQAQCCFEHLCMGFDSVVACAEQSPFTQQHFPPPERQTRTGLGGAQGACKKAILLHTETLFPVCILAGCTLCYIVCYTLCYTLCALCATLNSSQYF